MLLYTDRWLVRWCIWRIPGRIYVLFWTPLSQYLVEPRHVHLVVAKHVMRYLKGTLNFGLCYTKDHDSRLYGYTDSDWARSVPNRKSTSRCFSLGSAMTSWKSREQSRIAPSTTEVEYIATCSASCEAIWLRMLLTDLFYLEMESIVILCDNHSCIKMMCSLMSRST